MFLLILLWLNVKLETKQKQQEWYDCVVKKCFCATDKSSRIYDFMIYDFREQEVRVEIITSLVS
jgi:hypothetical protein